ncbi:MAG: TIGR04283 family arsenosugar biosynthesis glycosyltransferase [Desulfocapsa sp.]|nr:TIGR04283 family arsenosugar biosynthesis glycosyltransferase [Desulfocapsa sp.]
MTSTTLKTFNISIIVPTLNEAHNLKHLQPAAAITTELIVVDGGSTDDTVTRAKELGFQVQVSTQGRGAQLNLGAAAAVSPLLLFLHADTILPQDFATAITKCLTNPDTILGAFSLNVEQAGPLLKLICKGANIRAGLFKLPYGDQSLFLRKKDFPAIGGFPEIEIMEDYVFVKRAKKRGNIVTLRQTVTTSSRRWQNLGPIRTTLLNQLVVLGYHLGVSPKKLALFYRSRGRRGGAFRKFSGNKGTDTIC